MGTLEKLKNALVLLAFFISAVGIIVLILVPDYVQKFVSASIFYALLLLFILLLGAIIVFKKVSSAANGSCKSFSIDFRKKMYYILAISLIIAFLTSIYVDVFLLNSIFYSAIMLMFGVVLSIVMTRCSYKLALFCISFIFVSYIVALYAFYPPLFGIDSWRDSAVAIRILEGGYASGVATEGYQIPVVSILYAILSLILEISPVYASVLMGVIYILITVLVAFLISIKLCGKMNTLPSFLTVILVLSIPILVLWSVSFIPEVYSFMMFMTILIILFFGSHGKAAAICVTFPLLVALVLGHGGSSLWCIGFFVCLLLMLKVLKSNNAVVYPLLKRIATFLIIITIFDFTYTTLLGIVTNNVKNVLDVLLNFVSFNQTNAMPFSGSSGSAAATGILSYGSMGVIAVVVFIAWLGNKPEKNDFKKIFIATAFIYGMVMLFISFLGVAYDPGAALTRYLGFGSLFLFSIIASIGFQEFAKRRIIGRLFMAVLVSILVLNMGCGAVLSPNFNPFNTQSPYSIQSPPTWEDQTSLSTIASFFNNGEILSDWATTLSITNIYYGQYSIKNVSSVSSASTNNVLYTSQGVITGINLGFRFTQATYDYIASHFEAGGIFIYRAGALDDLNLLANIDEQELLCKIEYNYNVVYDGSVEVISR